MNLSPRNRLIVVAALAFVVLIVMVVALVLPAAQQIGAVQEQIDAATEDSDSARILLEQRRQIRDRAAATDVRVLELAVAVPENPDLPSLVIDLQDLATESGVFLSSIQPSPLVVSETAPHVGMPIDLVVQGPWADVVDYLQQLRRLPRQLRVNDVVVTVVAPPEGEEAESDVGISVPPYYQVNAAIRVTAYIIPASALTSPTAEAPAPAPAPEQ